MIDRDQVKPQLFLHRDRWKMDLTLSLSFSLFLIRGKSFRVAYFSQRTRRKARTDEVRQVRKGRERERGRAEVRKKCK